MRQRDSQFAFTLAELLIALAILGVIATFTIPKILDSQTSSKYNSIVKEVAAMYSGAYQSYKLDNSASAATTLGDLTPYMNYVAVSSTLTLDNVNNFASNSCTSVTRTCLILHSGAVIYYPTDISFGDTQTTNVLWFNVDPDGVYGGSTTGPSKSAQLYLYFNGRIVSVSDVLPNSYNSTSGPFGPVPANEAEYFSWSN